MIQIQFTGGKNSLKRSEWLKHGSRIQDPGQAHSVERGWWLVLAHGEGRLCIFISLLCRSCSTRNSIEKSASSKSEGESLHLSPAEWIFLELWAFFFSSHSLTSVLKDFFLCGLLSMEVAVVGSQGFQQRVVKYTEEKVHIESCSFNAYFSE